jgi:BirA family biotin operon repressor/biotin-[acetyl-CoA-carboxylase] ligase
VNVNQNKFPVQIKEKATSLKLIKGQKIDRVKLLQKILSIFEELYQLLVGGEDNKILELWKQQLNILNTSIVIKSNCKTYRGTAIDISSRGELVIRNEEGQIMSFWAGDASLRKEVGK